MLTLYKPFSSLLRDDLGNGDWSSLFGNALTRAPSSFTPAVDVLEKDGNYLIKAEVPGLAPEDIQVEVDQNVLSLRGERKYEHQEEDAGYRRVERRYGSFVRSFVLPDGTNADAIEAKVENGILTVAIPKVQTAPPRKVEVKGGGIVEKAKKIFGKSGEEASA
jgi:HSP20 family protein